MLAFPQPRSSYISKVIIGKKAYLYFQLIVRFSFVPASLVGEAEGEIWPNPICTTWSPVRNVTGQARAHAQNFKSIYLKVSWSMKKKNIVFHKISTLLIAFQQKVLTSFSWLLLTAQPIKEPAVARAIDRWRFLRLSIKLTFWLANEESQHWDGKAKLMRCHKFRRSGTDIDSHNYNYGKMLRVPL